MSLYRDTIPDELFEKAVRLYGANCVSHPSGGLLCIKGPHYHVLKDLGIAYDHEYSNTVRGRYSGQFDEVVQHNYNRMIKGVCHNVAYELRGMSTIAILVEPRIDMVHACPFKTT